MRSQTPGRDAHFIAGEASRARADKRVQHPQVAGLPLGQEPFHPLRRKAGAVAKPPMDRQPHVVEKVGCMTDDLEIRANLLGSGIFAEQIQYSLPVILAEAEQFLVAW